ncbi:hypothetical protein Cni_G05064 [Canna indica]|uniref:Reverse transcriptase zinc-binding domain-containing protein n=1 Tax=Canna indica TaxID=4628 RepID=A0AAQ3JUJ4_9LILI|nr:hypothetical protein Cni_G05064 [Canna indica]
MRIVNGKKSKIWDDPWICEVPLVKWPTFIDCNQLEKLVYVQELFNESGWNGQLIEKCFGDDLKNKIEIIQVDMEGGDDHWIWKDSKLGEASVRSAYWHLKSKEDLSVESDVDWRKIWNLKISQNVKIFIWKLMWGRLPVSD